MPTQIEKQATAPIRARWRALGTTAELLLLGEAQQLEAARIAIERWLERVDRACSRFREDSELSRLNAAAGRALEVSPVLIEATQLALRAARLSDGAVDPTLGAELERAGYDRDWQLMAFEPGRTSPAAQSRDAGQPRSAARVSPLSLRARARPRWASVRVDPARRTIALPRGVKLDLGATAKAWAADCAARVARSASGCGALVSLGGDLATCGPCPAGGWRVHVTDDHRDGPEAPGQTISIRGGGIATSSTTVRRWRVDGHWLHHIIDPDTGVPAISPWRTVSVAAADCADANIAATAAIVRGERALPWLAQAGLPARLATSGGRVVTVGPWPEPGWRG
jgi:thiamine biosynthesis lipoprotein